MGFCRISVYKDLHDHYYFKLADANGETLVTSVTYRTHSDCSYAIRTMRTVILDENCFKLGGTPGDYFFSVYTRENISLANSKPFRTVAGRNAGKELFQKVAAIAEVEDRSLFVRYFRV